MLRMVLLGAALTGCSIFNAPPDSYSDTTDPSSSTSGPEAVEDTAVDTGGDDDSGDSDTNSFDCAQSVQPIPPPDDCVTRTISCGDQFVDTTVAGASVMDAEEYSAWYCMVFPEGDYAGSERIYYFTHPGDGTVTVELNSPCAELDLVVLQWEYWATDGTCPNDGHSIAACDAAKGGAGGSVEVWDNSDSNYMIIVDGPEPVEDIFELSLTCP